MPLGPWNNVAPPNFLEAAHAGAAIGTALRGQDIARAEAADRLAMAYQQMAMEQHRLDTMAKLQADRYAAANALRERHINMLENWHRAQVQAMEDRIHKPQVHFGTQGEVLEYDPDNGQLTEVKGRNPDRSKVPQLSVPLDPNNPFGPKMTGPADDPRVQDALQKAQAAQAALNAPAPPSGGSATVTNVVNRAKNALANVLGLNDQPSVDEAVPPFGRMPETGGPQSGLLQPTVEPFSPSSLVPQSGALNPTMPPPPVPNAGPASVTAAPPFSPFKEGALIRNKKNGKLYRVTNGVPIEEQPYQPPQGEPQNTEDTMPDAGEPGSEETDDENE